MTTANTQSLYDRQLALEEDSLEQGIAAFREKNARLEQQGLQTATEYGKKLLAKQIEPLEQAIIKFVADAYTTPGPKAAAVKYLELAEPSVVAFIAAQVIIDGIAMMRTYQNVSHEIGSRMEDEARFRQYEGDNKALFNGVMRHLEKHPMGYQRRVRRSMLVRSAKKFGIVWSAWPKPDKVLLGSTLIDLFITSTGLVSLAEKPAARGGSMYVLQPTQELSDWIKGYKDAGEILRPKYLPMLCPPKPWTTLNDGGYHSGKLKLKLVKARSRGYQKELLHNPMPEVYSAVNALQATPWRINVAMHTIVKELWEAGLEVKGFPPRLDHPRPIKPADIDTNKEARVVWKKLAGDTFRANVRNGSKRVQTAKIMYIADKFVSDDAIFFPVTLDFRGRMYSVPNHLNPQGCDLAKSLLTFSTGKPLGKLGVYWLGVHIANTFGHDKVSLQARHEWTLENSDRIASAANDPLGDRWWMEADKPFQFLAACIEWLGYLNDGGESYVSSLPVMVDGSCNGLQHFSAMLRDEVCGANVNLIPSEKPSDIYAVVADAVTATLKAEERSEFKMFADQWAGYGVNRKLCKRPVMVLPYGGTRESVRQYVLDATIERSTEGHDLHPFGDSLLKATQYLASVIWETMKKVVKGPRVAMDWLQQSARVVAKVGLPIVWRTPTGFIVHQAYPDLSSRIVKTKVGGKIVKLTLQEEHKTKLDSRKQAQAVAPNFVHSLDASALVLTIVRSEQRGVTSFAAIHDSYGTHAADMPVLLDTLRECFVQMYETHDVLADFHSEIAAAADGKEVPAIPARGTLDLSGVLRSDFFFA